MEATYSAQFRETHTPKSKHNSCSSMSWALGSFFLPSSSMSLPVPFLLELPAPLQPTVPRPPSVGWWQACTTGPCSDPCSLPKIVYHYKDKAFSWQGGTCEKQIIPAVLLPGHPAMILHLSQIPSSLPLPGKRLAQKEHCCSRHSTTHCICSCKLHPGGQGLLNFLSLPAAVEESPLWDIPNRTKCWDSASQDL